MRTAESKQEPLAVRLYRSLLFVYPAEFRREYATEMKLTFQDRWEEESGHGAARLWLQTLVDLACSAVREHLDQLAGDVRHAARTLWNDRSYAFIATAVLALGIAASTIAFTVLNATLIRPLPYPEADRLVAIDQVTPERGTGLAWPQFDELIRDPGTLADVGGCAHAALTLVGDPGPEEVTGSEITFGMIALLRVNPIIGRLFTEQEHRRGNDAVILLSHSLWRTRYGGDPAIVGKQIRTISRPFTVVGVMPPWFRFPGSSQFWVPGGPDSWYIWKPTTLFIQAFGRIHAGATLEQARSGIETIMKRIDQKHDSTSWGQSTRVRQLRNHLNTSFRPSVLVSTGAIGLLLLVSCANIGNLLLARASTRHRALTLRAALGADRSRIIRQLLVESTAGSAWRISRTAPCIGT